MCLAGGFSTEFSRYSPGVTDDGEPQRRGQKVVDAVLRATVEELARVGFAALSFESVAERAAVNKTTVYRRWPTKSELVRAAIVSQIAHKVPLPDTGNVHDDLVELVRGAADTLGSVAGRGLFAAVLSTDVDDEIADIARTIRENDLRPRKVLRRAVRRGELPLAVDIDLALDALLGAVHNRS